MARAIVFFSVRDKGPKIIVNRQIDRLRKLGAIKNLIVGTIIVQLLEKEVGIVKILVGKVKPFP